MYDYQFTIERDMGGTPTQIALTEKEIHNIWLYYDQCKIGEWIWERLQSERDAGNPEFYCELFCDIQNYYNDCRSNGYSQEAAMDEAFSVFEEQITEAVINENLED